MDVYGCVWIGIWDEVCHFILGNPVPDTKLPAPVFCLGCPCSYRLKGPKIPMNPTAGTSGTSELFLAFPFP